MKKTFLKVGCLLLVALMYFNVSFATEGPPDSGGGGGGDDGGGMGCYVSYVLACGLGLGDAKVCDFTGVYGEPYRCTEYSCAWSTTNRRCVQPE